MKVILDENIHVKLASLLPGHNVEHVSRIGLSGKKNGELLRICMDQGFEAFITMDQNLEYQQNLRKYEIQILVIRAVNNRLETLENLLPKVMEVLGSDRNLIVIE